MDPAREMAIISIFDHFCKYCKPQWVVAIEAATSGMLSENFYAGCDAVKRLPIFPHNLPEAIRKEGSAHAEVRWSQVKKQEVFPVTASRPSHIGYLSLLSATFGSKVLSGEEFNAFWRWVEKGWLSVEDEDEKGLLSVIIEAVNLLARKYPLAGFERKVRLAA